MSTQNLSINLLEHDLFTSSTIGKILTWALSIGRYIVVFTELIVILSFLSRFKLDRELTDINSEIVKQTAIIESYGDLETRVKHLQEQLKIVKENKEAAAPTAYLDILLQNLPPDVRLNRIQLSSTGFQFSGESLSRSGITTFITSLQRQPEFSQVSLTQLENNSQEGYLVFNVTVEVL